MKTLNNKDNTMNNLLPELPTFDDVDDLFQVDDLFESAAHYGAALAEIESAAEKPAEVVEKVRIRAYSDDYYKWLAMDSKARAKIEVSRIVEEAKGSGCSRCGGTGIFQFDNGNRGVCHQCAGSGTVTAVDAARTAKYWKRLESGASMDKHYSQYML